jgi:hypothetical protein
MNNRQRVLSIILALMLPATAFASSITFTNRASWEAAVGIFFTEDFNAIAAQLLPIGATAVGPFVITLTGTINDTTGIGPGLYGNPTNQFIGFIENDPGFNEVSQIKFDFFPVPMYAWGADFLSTASGDILVATSNGSIYDFSSLVVSGNGFLGSIEDASFSSITFTTKTFTTIGEYWEMDNLSYSPIPEPASLILLAIGIVAVSMACRRKNSV